MVHGSWNSAQKRTDSQKKKDNRSKNQKRKKDGKSPQDREKKKGLKNIKWYKEKCKHKKARYRGRTQRNNRSWELSMLSPK